MKLKGKRKISNIYLFSLVLFFAFTIQIHFSSGAVAVLSPLNGTNHSSAASVLFNVTFVNGTDLFIQGTSQSQVNASFYSVSGGVATLITNSSTCAVSSGSTYACWTTFTLSSSNDGFFNVSATVFNTTSSVGASVNTTSIYFDSTPPAVSANNFTSPVLGGNYSSILQLNVSIIDVTIGVNHVFFNITDSSGEQNSTIVASNSAGNIWNASINTSHYPEGTYNITVYVNDSLNNLNNSARIFSIYFDNTAPTASVSCSPSSVKEGETITCSCSPSDALTGIASISINSNPSTSQTGTFTSSCSVVDTAGNIGSGSVTYTVVSGGSSSSGSGIRLSPVNPSTEDSGSNNKPSTSTEGSEQTDSEILETSESKTNGSKKILIFVIATILVATIIVFVLIKNKK